MSVPPTERQGYLGNLQNKSLPELQDLLQRQIKLLSKPHFLHTLPDKGKKVSEFASVLEDLIVKKGGQRISEIPMDTDTRRDLKTKTKVLNSKFYEGRSVNLNVLSKSKQPVPHTVEQSGETQDNVQDVVTLNLPNCATNENMIGTKSCKEEEKDRNSSTCSSDAYLDFPLEETNSCQMAGSSHISNDFTRLRDKGNMLPKTSSEDISVVNGNAASQRHTKESIDTKSSSSKVYELSSTGLTRKTQDELALLLSQVNLGTKYGDDSLDDHQEVLTKVIKKSEEVNQCFRPNSCLKIKDVKDLPKKYLYKSKDVKSQREDSSSPVTITVREESAATPPVYKYQSARLLSLAESVQLQQLQQAKQEEIQNKLASKRLAERLNVKMDTYNPEGVNISYRITEQIDIDSDDEPEVEGYIDD